MEFLSGNRRLQIIAALLPALLIGTTAWAQDNTQDLAKKLSNPIASLISVPFQFNYDSGYGPNDGDKAYVNVQPVIPITLNDNWNLISRTILPVAWQHDIAGPSGDQFGLGDISQSLFFSPSKPTDSSGVDAKGRMDGGYVGEPHLVVRRRQRPQQYQCHLSAAFHRVHDQGRLDLQSRPGEHLQLGSTRVVGPDQLPGLEAGRDRQAADQLERGRSLLGCEPGQRA